MAKKATAKETTAKKAAVKKKTMSWAITIRRLMKKAGIYQPHFEPTIKQLGDIMDRREKAYAEWKEQGEEFQVVQTNSRGAENYVVNPLVTRIEHADETALQYWDKLGFTAKSYKGLVDTSGKDDKPGLESILKKIGC